MMLSVDVVIATELHSIIELGWVASVLRNETRLHPSPTSRILTIAAIHWLAVPNLSTAAREPFQLILRLRHSCVHHLAGIPGVQRDPPRRAFRPLIQIQPPERHFLRRDFLR